MSLYNIMHGVGGNARIALAMLGKSYDDFGRFRDAWIEPGGDVLAVFTRCGGGNRDDYGGVFDMVAAMPGFIRDEDDDFDCTYCTFTFKTPEAYQPLAAALAPKEPPPTLLEKTNAVIESFKATPPKDVPADRVGEIVAAIEAAVASERSEKVAT